MQKLFHVKQFVEKIPFSIYNMRKKWYNEYKANYISFSLDVH